MFKKLDTLILRSFVAPFFATFFISLFVLVMQFFWLYIDDLVGKGLEVTTIFKLIAYVTATLVPLALPLAMLLSSIMTFGNLGETFELVAIKSSGISLLRFMRPLLIVAIAISGLAFVFANNVIPVAQLKLAALKYDIIIAKPAFDIKEGVFYNQIKDFAIKIGKKEKDDSTIKNIVIFEKRYGIQDNIIVADSGIMKVSNNKKFLEFVLKDGWRYEEKAQANSATNTDYIRLGFKEYKKIFDLRSLQMNQSADSSFRYDPKMLSIRQLNYSIDSFKTIQQKFIKRNNTEVAETLPFVQYVNATFKQPKPLKHINNIAAIIPDSIRSIIFDNANSKLNIARNTTAIAANDFEFKNESKINHQIEWHRKFTLSFACIVLFLIGAPLGSIIRKGGLGLPLVFSIIFFIIFHMINTFGEKFVEESVASPFVGMWLSSMILLPIGFFLTFKAMRDSQLFNQEFYYRTFKGVREFIKKFKKIKV